MSADKLPAELLRENEATFYPGAGKRFRQDRGMLLEAILLPVDYIHSQRDLVAAPSLYREIVRKGELAQAPVADGDQIEIVHFVGGG